MKINCNEHGFTLIEMMIVLLIISILVVIAIPNVTKHAATIDEKGCEAYVRMVEGQVQAYKIEFAKVPHSVEQLVEASYLPKGAQCPDGRSILINEEGDVHAELKDVVDGQA